MIAAPHQYSRDVLSEVDCFKGLIRLASTLQEVSVHFDKISAVDRHLDNEDAVREPPETIQLHGMVMISANTANPSWVRVVPG